MNLLGSETEQKVCTLQRVHFLWTLEVNMNFIASLIDKTWTTVVINIILSSKYNK